MGPSGRLIAMKTMLAATALLLIVAVLPAPAQAGTECFPNPTASTVCATLLLSRSGTLNASGTIWVSLDLYADGDHFSRVAGGAGTLSFNGVPDSCNIALAGGTCSTHVHITLANIPRGTCFAGTATTTAVGSVTDAHTICV